MRNIFSLLPLALLGALPAHAFQNLAEVKAGKAASAVTIRYTSPGPGRVSLYRNGQFVQGVAVVETGGAPCAAGAGLALTARDVLQVRRDRGDAAIAVAALEITDRSDKYEAESALLLGGARAYSAAAASGGKAVRYLQKTGDGVRFNRVSGGSVLRVRYATPESYCNMSLHVNGRFAKTIPFRNTGGWNEFLAIDLPVSVPAGATVTIVRGPDDGGAALDSIELLGAAAGPAPELAPAAFSPPVEASAASRDPHHGFPGRRVGLPGSDRGGQGDPPRALEPFDSRSGTFRNGPPHPLRQRRQLRLHFPETGIHPPGPGVRHGAAEDRQGLVRQEGLGERRRGGRASAQLHSRLVRLSPHGSRATAS